MVHGPVLSRKQLRRLIVSGRDAGTARFVDAIAGEGQQSGIVVDIVAQRPAYDLLRHSGRTVIEAPGNPRPWVGSEANEVLLNWTYEFLERLCPDAVLTTVSGGGTGIDEALLRCADIFSTPSLSYQGYWGNVNGSTTLLPDVLLVADAEAEAITRARLGSRTPRLKAVGSLMAQALAQEDWVSVRDEVRSNLLGPNRNAVMTGIMLQPLAHWPGYVEAVRHWATAAAEYGLAVFVAHPSDPEAAYLRDIKVHGGWATPRGVRRVLPGDMNGVRVAAGSDIVVSAFSSSLVEAAYIASTLPDGEGPAPVYLLPGQLYESFRESTGLSAPPLVDAGCAFLARPEDAASHRRAFIQALEMRRSLNLACRSKLEMRTNVARRIFREIERLVRDGRTSVRGRVQRSST